MNKILVCKFALYGFIGMIAEVIYTAIVGFDISLKGVTYLWMHPIWACGFFVLIYLHNKVCFRFHWLIRGLIYMLSLFAVEYMSGMLLKITTGQIPWDYSDSPYNLHGAIKASYAPLWFGAGLSSEYVVRRVDEIFGCIWRDK